MAGGKPRPEQIRQRCLDREDRPIIDLGNRVVQEDSGCWLNIPATAVRHLDINDGDEMQWLLDGDTGELIVTQQNGGE